MRMPQVQIDDLRGLEAYTDGDELMNIPLFIVAVATMTMNGKAIERVLYATSSLEIACAIKSDTPSNIHVNVMRGSPMMEGWLFTPGEWCPPKKAKESEPFDFEKLLDEIERELGCRKFNNRFLNNVEILKLQKIIADPDTTEKKAMAAAKCIAELRTHIQDDSLNRFMGIK